MSYHAQSVRLDDGNYEGRVFPFSGPDAGEHIWGCGHSHDDQRMAEACAYGEKVRRTANDKGPMVQPEATGLGFGPIVLRATILQNPSGFRHLRSEQGGTACGATLSRPSRSGGTLDDVTCGNCRNTLEYRELALLLKEANGV